MVTNKMAIWNLGARFYEKRALITWPGFARCGWRVYNDPTGGSVHFYDSAHFLFLHSVGFSIFMPLTFRSPRDFWYDLLARRYGSLNVLGWEGRAKDKGMVCQ